MRLADNLAHPKQFTATVARKLSPPLLTSFRLSFQQFYCPGKWMPQVCDTAAKTIRKWKGATKFATGARFWPRKGNSHDYLKSIQSSDIAAGEDTALRAE